MKDDYFNFRGLRHIMMPYLPIFFRDQRTQGLWAKTRWRYPGFDLPPSERYCSKYVYAPVKPAESSDTIQVFITSVT